MIGCMIFVIISLKTQLDYSKIRLISQSKISSPDRKEFKFEIGTLGNDNGASVTLHRPNVPATRFDARQTRRSIETSNVSTEFRCLVNVEIPRNSSQGPLQRYDTSSTREAKCGIDINERTG